MDTDTRVRGHGRGHRHLKNRDRGHEHRFFVTADMDAATYYFKSIFYGNLSAYEFTIVSNRSFWLHAYWKHKLEPLSFGNMERR